MIFLRLLDHDLHMSRIGKDAMPLILETPSSENFLPSIVSTIDSGRFLVVRKMKDGKIRSGIFKHDPDRIDEIIKPLTDAAFDLSKTEKFGNIFKSSKKAFEFIRDSAGTGAHPHILLMPNSSANSLEKVLGKMYDGKSYGKICKVILSDVSRPIFFSRPDFVGLYTQFVGGSSSILLHNVKNGMSFVDSV